MADRIMVATDGSDIASRAVDFAAELSDKLGHDLRIVHVLMHGRPSGEYMRLAEAEHLVGYVKRDFPDLAPGDPATLGDFFDGLENDAREARAVSILGDEILARARTQAQGRGARNVTTLVSAGDFADEILDLAETEQPRMIVLGSRGLGRVRGALLGSVSQKVLHHANCIVVVVR